MASWGVRMATGAAAVALLGMSACGVDPASKGGSTPGGKPSASKSDAPLPAELVEVDQALIAGARTVTYSDPERKVSTAVPFVPGSRILSSAMEVVREKALRTAAQQGATAVDVRSRVIAASPSAVGVEVQPTMTTAEGERSNPVVVWLDPAARRVYSSPILVDAQQWGSFKQAVAKAAGKAVDAKRLSQALDAEAAPQGAGPALGFDKQGNLVARFAAGTVADQAYGVVVPAAAADPVLSTFGRAAQAATRTPSAYDPAAPTPSTSASSSASPSASASGQPTASGTPAPGGSASPGNQVPRPSTAVGVDCTRVACVALTYDDGPGESSNKVVEAFVKEGEAATFFQLSPMIKENSKNARLIASSGMEVGDHTVTHNDLARMSGDKLRGEIENSAATMREVYGRSPMLLRPPYGSHNKAVDDLAGRNDMAIIQWSVDTNDWKTKNTMSTEAAASAAKANQIVLMHDIHDSTVAAAPSIIRDLKGKGMALVTVSELSLNSGGYEAGHAYCTATSQKQSGFLCNG